MSSSAIARELTLEADPRVDPAIVGVLAPLGLGGTMPPPPREATRSHADRLALCDQAETRLQSLLALLWQGASHDPAGVERGSAPGRGGTIPLEISRPRDGAVDVPCFMHLHGGGMTVLSAQDPTYRRWREDLAGAGAVVVGVEFRNAAGALGPHAFPAGLEDCIDAVRWAARHLDELGASHLVLVGDSGGANLASAVALSAAAEGWSQEIAGVALLCPFLAGDWSEADGSRPSVAEFDGYFASRGMYEVFAAVYDPERRHGEDMRCWPLKAGPGDLAGLPPHFISVNELDLLRDEGVLYLRRLRAAGVAATGQVLLGTTHGADVVLPGLDGARRTTIGALLRFAHDLRPRRER